jgi:hypothetical protein
MTTGRRRHDDENAMIRWWNRDATMVKTQWYYDENAMVRWWNHDGTMVKQRWNDGKTTKARWWKTYGTIEKTRWYNGTIIKQRWYDDENVILYRVFTTVPLQFRDFTIVFSSSYLRVFIIVPSYDRAFTIVPSCIAVQGDKKKYLCPNGTP